MQTRWRLLHEWTAHFQAVVPGLRATRVRVLTLFVLGMIWAESVTLLKIAASLPLSVQDLSTEQRLRRFLANEQIEATAIWQQVLPSLVAGQAGQEVVLVLDPTPQNATATVISVGIIERTRTLPVAWRVVPQQTTWPDRQIVYLRAMFAEIAAALPAGCTVTLLTDRGLTAPDLIDLCTELGWHYVLRQSISAGQTNRVRVGEAPEQRLWELVTGPGQHWCGTVALFKEAGWRTVALTIRWDRGAAEPWVLISDRAAGVDRVREYRRRMRVEATYEDEKRRGFQIEGSKVTDPDRFNRLLLVLHLALWMGMQLGLRAIRCGERRRYDRPDRRDLSVLRLGRRWLADLLLHDRRPPLPFHATPSGWSYTWLS
jgi:hypothetical protein